MRVTRRRMEFLAKIKQLYEKNNLPVHYVRVAELLRVSKWSAYEMLKTLEKEGFLASEYAVNQQGKFPGRSMVLFSPTRLVDELFFGAGHEERVPFKEWRQVKERLLFLCAELKNTGSKQITDQLLAEMPSNEHPLVFGAYTIALLTAYLQNLGEKSVGLVERVVLKATKAEMGLVMFAGTVMGSMLKTAGQFSLVSQLAGYVVRFQRHLAEFSQLEKTLLMEFLEEALGIAR